MGMTKALMEKTAQAFARNNPNSLTTVAVVRYGNALYSRGSVVPLFVEQITSGRPLTITGPRMSRRLMSLDEAGDLVEDAMRKSATGDPFVREATAITVK